MNAAAKPSGDKVIWFRLLLRSQGFKMHVKDGKAAQHPTYGRTQFYHSKFQQAVKDTTCFYGSCPKFSRYIERPFYDVLAIFKETIGSTVNFCVETGLDEKGWKQQRKDLSQYFKRGGALLAHVGYQQHVQTLVPQLCSFEP